MIKLPESLATLGYAISSQAIRPAVCEALREQALTALGRNSWDLNYQVSRWVGASRIKNPWCRHAVPLEYTPVIKEALAGVSKVVLAAGLPLSAQLVEMSAAITLPGASDQRMHPDIAPVNANVRNGNSEVAPLVTAWLSLQCIKCIGDGPTVVYPTSHRRYALRSARVRREQQEDAQKLNEIMRGIEGDWEFREERQAEIARARRALALEASALDDEREEREFGSLESTPLLLGLGDVALMDCRILHFGSAYPRRSFFSSDGQAERILFNATFASAGLGAEKIEGFTYHRHACLPKLSLGEAAGMAGEHQIRTPEAL